MRICENGIYRDMTEEETRETQLELQAHALDALSNTAEPTPEEKMALFINAIPVTAGETKEDGTPDLSPKLGYRWQLRYSTASGSFVWELEEDPDAVGTAENPILYYDGCPLFVNGFYTSGGKTYVCVNAEGTPSGIEDNEYFEAL